ncbi:heme peroxidase [Gorgonomyces haynaldii]|nr:heme peroxidase [Gorgonomyces haynaldii]
MLISTVLAADTGPAAKGYRSINGYGNNLAYPSRGSQKASYSRNFAPAAFADGISALSGPSRPNPKTISNTLFGRMDSVENPEPISDLLPYWGQFIAHDVALTQANDSDIMQLTVDEFVGCTGTTTLNVSRAQVTNVPFVGRSVINYATSFVDASTVYGHSTATASTLRTFTNGLLKSSLHPKTGQEFPPLLYNTSSDFNKMESVPNRFGGPIFLCGDQRCNIHPVLQTLHTLFLREHNRRARELKSLNPSWNDETLYQRARAWVIALVQKITYTEYLPALLGQPLDAYGGYIEALDPSIDSLFVGAAMRYGHSAISPTIMRIPEGHLNVRDHWFSTRGIMNTGEIDSILRGLTKERDQETDTIMVDDLRKHLVLQPFDLAARNIMRGRDLGLPSYSDARDALGFDPITDFSNITSDTTVADLLKTLYGNYLDIDVWVGGLAEDHEDGSHVGPLFSEIIARQFIYLREGDRFWYERNGVLTTDEKGNLTDWKLKKVVMMNTNISVYPSAPFSYYSGVFTNTDADKKQQTATFTADSNMKIMWASTDMKAFTFTLCGSNSGWLGIGFNTLEVMSGAVLFVATKASTWSVDVYNSNSNVPVLNTNIQVSGIQDAQSTCGTTQGVSFVINNNNYFASSGKSAVLYAYGSSMSFNYHGPASRGAKSIDIVAALAEGSVTVEDNTMFLLETKLVTVHGICMFVTYGLLYPVGIFLIRYLGGVSNTVVTYHTEFMYYGSLLSEFATILLLFGILPKYSKPHPIMGLTVSALMLITPMFGMLAKGKFKFAFKYNKIFRLTHRALGYFTLLLGYATAGMGVNDISGYNTPLFGMKLVYIFIGWAVMWILIYVILGEMGYMRHFLIKYRRSSMRRRSKSLHSSQNLVTKALTFSRVYEVDTFLSNHPGGAALLASTLGTDATRAYFGNLSMAQDSNEKQQLLKDDLKNNIHHHSTLANRILADMAVGFLQVVDEQQEEFNDFIDNNTGKSPIKRSSLNLNPNDVGAKMRAKFGHKALLESEQESAIEPHAIKPEYYSRMFLVEKRCLTKDSQYPVYAFKFRFEREKCQVLLVPGDSIELMFLLEPLPDGKPRQHRFVVRSYTLTQVFSQSTIEIYVKMMPDGQMSKHLSQLKVGQSIRCRGPHQHSLCLYLGSDFGVYQKLILICAGSGLTPMLLLIDYYLRCKAKGANVTEIILIQSFRDQGDLFLQDRVGEYVKKSDGILKVHTTLTGDCGKDWKGMTGRVTERMLFSILKPSESTDLLNPMSPPSIRVQAHHEDGYRQNLQEMTVITTEPPMSPLSPLSPTAEEQVHRSIPAVNPQIARVASTDSPSQSRTGSPKTKRANSLKLKTDQRLARRKRMEPMTPSYRNELHGSGFRNDSLGTGFKDEFISGLSIATDQAHSNVPSDTNLTGPEQQEHIFICGPSTFNDSVQDMLLDALNYLPEVLSLFWGDQPTVPTK